MVSFGAWSQFASLSAPGLFAGHGFQFVELLKHDSHHSLNMPVWVQRHFDRR
jgi:hypothetical protein